jgi:IS30 family transposase
LNTYEYTEKRRRVIGLRKEGWTVRDIATELHMSSRTVIGILKDNSSKKEREDSGKKAQEQQNALQTNYTKALRLFKDGKSLLDVTIELGVFAEETMRAFFDFQEITGVDNFREAYEHIKSSLSALLILWEMMKERGLGVKDALVAIEYAKDHANAERELQVLTNKVEDMKIQKLASKMQLSESLDKRPPAIPKAATNRIVGLGERPKNDQPG